MAGVEEVFVEPQSTYAVAADIPKVSASGDAEDLGASPPTNSHQHESEEYDTASEDSFEQSGSEDDDESTDIDDDEEDDDEALNMDESRQQSNFNADKVDAETQKKVDEDRSNPQYIPKRGTFYEHDDRTAECDADGVVVIGDATENNEGVSGTAGASKSAQSPTVSHASKNMKKWQPASGVDRWEHDRYDPNDQAPKSRSELVSNYGYDIRTEDAPPRARRRRRYGRGPSKYSRNWEDENAYLKTSNNKERKPPRASDFPALNERDNRERRSSNRIREEKENRTGRRQSAGYGSGRFGDRSGTGAAGGERRSTQDEYQERDREHDDKRYHNKKGFARNNAQAGRQAPMEFKPKNRGSNQSHQTSAATVSNQNSRNGPHVERHAVNRQQNTHENDVDKAFIAPASPTVSLPPNTAQQTPQQSNHNDAFMNNNSNNNKIRENPFRQQPSPQSQQVMNVRQASAPPPKTTQPTSNLTQRLQQAQNRNDPSHVGSIQMHALATQNQLTGQQQQHQQQQQQQAANMLISQQQQQQQQSMHQLPQEQRGPPKRYSSMRRAQHDPQHMAEHHQLQQLHLQHQAQQQQTPLMLQDQHMMQAANLMQLYHQENLQAQMQAMQISQGAAASNKQSAYSAPLPPTAQPPPQAFGPAAGSAVPPTAYYVSATDAYAANAAASAQAPPAVPYAQPPANYLAQPPTGPPLPYASVPPQQSVPAAPQAAYVPAASVPNVAGGPVAAPPTAAAGASPNFGPYQNYNTVGGTTYFVPPVQATSRPTALPQRRPTNAIPILPPTDKNKQQRPSEDKDDSRSSNTVGASLGSAENIDHILDNMFVQRPAFQPPQVVQVRKSASPEINADAAAGTAVAVPDVNNSHSTGSESSSNINENIAESGGSIIAAQE